VATAGVLKVAPTAVLQRGAAERQEAFAIAGQSSDRDLIDDGGTTRREPHHIAVLDDERLLDLALAGELGMGDQMAGLAVNWDGYLRTDHLIHAHKLVSAGWPETWTK
jgi:hypothetical protein